MGRLRKKTRLRSVNKTKRDNRRQESSNALKDQSEALQTSHDRLDTRRRSSPFSPVEAAGTAVQPVSVVVEPADVIELTDIPARRHLATPSPRGDAGSYIVPLESTRPSKMSSLGSVESRCVKVTFKPEKPSRSRSEDNTLSRETDVMPLQQEPPAVTPSKGDVLSVVIQKLTELVNESERRDSSRTAESGSSSGRSTPSDVCGDLRQGASTKRTDPLYRCPKCPCLFALSAKQLQSREPVLCLCCEKARKTITCGSRDGSGSCGKQIAEGYVPTGELSKIKCELCSHIAGSYVDLLYHLLSKHADAKICKCKLCDFFTTIEARMQEHAAVHNAPHVYKCSSCPFVTGKLINLQEHMKSHNKDRELLLKCSECGFSCRCEDVLRTHMWEHIPSVHNTRGRAVTPQPMETAALIALTTSTDENRSPFVPSPALPSQSVGEQPYIFKCILCGYLCDRLATLKKHAWRHAGEQGCSYPVVDEDIRLKRTLSSIPTTALPSAGKPIPLAVLSRTKVTGAPGAQRNSSPFDGTKITDSAGTKEVAARETSETPHRCFCGPKDTHEEVASCHCKGINIPPSSVPLIKELLNQQKYEEAGLKTEDELKIGKDSVPAEQNSVPTSEAVNQSCNLPTRHHNKSLSNEKHKDQSSDVAFPTPDCQSSLSEANQHGFDKGSESSLHDPPVLLLVDPSDPHTLFVDLDMPIPEPAVVVEAITEQTSAVSPKLSHTDDDGARDSSFSKTHFASLPASKELSEITLQSTVNSQETAYECYQKMPQKVNKALSEWREGGVEGSSDAPKDSDTDRDTVGLSLIDSSSFTSEPSSQSGPIACQSNQDQISVNDTGEPPVVREKVADTCSPETVESQEKLTESLNTVLGVSSPLEKGVSDLLATATPELDLDHAGSEPPQNAMSYQLKQISYQESALTPKDETITRPKEEEKVSLQSSNSNKENSEALDTDEDSGMIQEKHMNNNNREVASVVAGHKRCSDSPLDEFSEGAKRECRCDQESRFDRKICTPVINQGNSTLSENDNQLESVRELERDLEKGKTQPNMSSEEDSIVQFFMNIIDGTREPFQCKLCSKTYEAYVLLKQHLQTHLVHNSFRCPLCREYFESLEGLKHHIQQHYKESHSCTECSAFFYSKNELQEHKQSHTALKEFKCDICTATISGQAEYIRHRKMVHSDHEKSHVRCTHCGEDFGSTNALLLHTLSCTMRKTRCCKECSFTSETTQGLQDHVRDCHLRVKFYKCTLCDYRSSAKNGIKNHMKFHATDRPYKCALCSFTGAYPQSLRSHMRMHKQPGWRPDCLPWELPEQYKCKLCCYTCNYLPSLKSHMWKHASDPNYSSNSSAPTTDSGLIQASPTIASQQRSGSAESSSSTTQGLQQRPGGTCNVVTFCCQECGFKSTDRAKLVEHLKMHLPPEMLAAERRKAKGSSGRKT